MVDFRVRESVCFVSASKRECPASKRECPASENYVSYFFGFRLISSRSSFLDYFNYCFIFFHTTPHMRDRILLCTRSCWSKPEGSFYWSSEGEKQLARSIKERICRLFFKQLFNEKVLFNSSPQSYSHKCNFDTQKESPLGK